MKLIREKNMSLSFTQIIKVGRDFRTYAQNGCKKKI